MATCLVVDDSESMREVASDILSAFGHEVREAPDADTALEACSADGVGIDVVLLDWDLPSLGALDFLRGAASLAPRPMIVLCATENDARQFGLARAVGAGHHVLKPYDAETLGGVLAEMGVASAKAVA